jgi:predicted  nucleic acid-binding Zn-ribbon protein
MQPWLDKLYTTLEAKEATLAREKKKGYSTNITENDIKNHKTKMVDTILEKGKKIDEKITKLKTSGKLDEARALKKEAYELKNIATKINSSRGGTRRRRRGKGTRKNGF